MGKGDKARDPARGVGTRMRMVRCCILFCAMGGMFGLGVLTGRGSAPVRFDIHKLEKRLLEVAGGTGNSEKEAELEFEFYDELRNNEGSRRPIRVKKAFPKKMEKRIPGKKRDEPEKPSAAAPTVASAPAAAKPEPKPKATPRVVAEKIAPKPSPAPPVKSPSAGEKSGAYAIQVAAFNEKRDAALMVVTLEKKGYAAYRTVSEGGKWHRVRIGSFKQKSDAAAVLARLKKDNIKAFLVNR